MNYYDFGTIPQDQWPRRGRDWDVFYCDGHGVFEIERVDTPDEYEDGGNPYFRYDEDAVAFVNSTATWHTHTPELDAKVEASGIIEECQRAVAEVAILNGWVTDELVAEIRAKMEG
jgi:hypothetical protein